MRRYLFVEGKERAYSVRKIRHIKNNYFNTKQTFTKGLLCTRHSSGSVGILKRNNQYYVYKSCSQIKSRFGRGSKVRKKACNFRWFYQDGLNLRWTIERNM